MIRSHGYWWVLLVPYLALPVRSAIAALLINGAGVWPVQILDGIGADRAAAARHRARQCRAGGGGHRARRGRGAEPRAGRRLAQHFGYASAFVVLGAVSLGSLALWLWHGGALREACGIPGADQDQGQDRDGGGASAPASASVP
ncbi:hypothetical protein [Burkholderia gladioli]|uniref:hypothetical protein n=1 Tax=Burkholderia gladioli TaxID=28095 RepID=UPI0039BF75A9